MQFTGFLCVAWAALAASGSATDLIHAAAKGLLQMPPSFSGDSVTLFPGLHPDHDPTDISHLLPDFSKDLYYSQEGHRPPLHGAKHAHFQLKYTRPTVILDHSSHIESVQCHNHRITVCFSTPHALETVTQSWMTLDTFHLVTYHVGCGDETTGKRTFFHASRPVIDSTCVTLLAVPIEEQHALDSGEVSWGTFSSPEERRRGTPIEGHVGVAKREEDTEGADESASGDTWDLTQDPVGLKIFFNTTQLNTTDMSHRVNTTEFVPMDGDLDHPRRRKRWDRNSPDVIIISDDGVDSYEGTENAFIKMCKTAWGWLKAGFETGVKIVKGFWFATVELVRLGVDLKLAQFGVPFERTYNKDVQVNKTLKWDGISTKPPQLFGHENGYKLGKEDEKAGTLGGETTVQCVKCGIYADFNLYGRLAFSMKEGVTDGTASFTNRDPFTLDAIFGVKAKGDYSETWDRKIKTFKPTPFSIPSLLTIGPMVTISAAFTAKIEGEADLVLGGSMTVAPGTARISLVKESDNGITGLGFDFTPKFQASGKMSLTGEFGLPVALEVGVEVLDGKWKKSAAATVTPALYLKGELSTSKENTCPQGLELLVGVKSPIVFSLFDLWKSQEFLEDPLWEKSLACITPHKITAQADAKNATGKVIEACQKNVTMGDLVKNTPPVDDITANFTHTHTPSKYRIVMSADRAGILVSGTDGKIYLVPSSADYDFSAPWASVDPASNILTMDTFGRLLAYVEPKNPWHYSVTNLVVVDPKKVPKTNRVAGIGEVKHQDIGRYGILWGTGKDFYFPTVCLTSEGFRLLGTEYMVTEDEEGKTKVTDPLNYTHGAKINITAVLERDFGNLGIELDDCRTTGLTSEVAETGK